MENRESITFGHVKVFLLGGLAGAVVALLFAPKTGKEMRGELKERAGKFKDSASESWQTVSAKGREVVDTVTTKGKEAYAKGSEMVSDRKDRLGAAISAGKSAAKEAYAKDAPAGKGEEA